MAGFHHQATGLPLGGARVAFTGNEAVGAALAEKQGYGLPVLVGYEGDA